MALSWHFSGTQRLTRLGRGFIIIIELAYPLCSLSAARFSPALAAIEYPCGKQMRERCRGRGKEVSWGKGMSAAYIVVGSADSYLEGGE